MNRDVELMERLKNIMKRISLYKESPKIIMGSIIIRITVSSHMQIKHSLKVKINSWKKNLRKIKI